MEKIIFFGLVIPIMGYVLYLGGMAIMNGFNAKEANRAEKEEVEEETKTSILADNGSLSEPLSLDKVVLVSSSTSSFSALLASLALNPFIIAIPPKYKT